MIIDCRGDMLKSAAQAIVNPVNCVGVMGKGLAKQIADMHPDVMPPYKTACSNGSLRIGKVQVVPVDLPGGGIYRRRWIINFPTKDHWRDRSSIAHISKGMRSLVNAVAEWSVIRVAIPPLGCGLGGLDRYTARTEIESGLGFMKDHPHIIVELYGF